MIIIIRIDEDRQRFINCHEGKYKSVKLTMIQKSADKKIKNFILFCQKVFAIIEKM